MGWTRGPMAELDAGYLGDPRVGVREADVGQVIAAARSRFDAILPDVDKPGCALGPPGSAKSRHPRPRNVCFEFPILRHPTLRSSGGCLPKRASA